MPSQDTEQLRKLLVVPFDRRELIAQVMYFSGRTYQDIGEVFGISRQGAQHLVKSNLEEGDKHA